MDRRTYLKGASSTGIFSLLAGCTNFLDPDDQIDIDRDEATEITDWFDLDAVRDNPNKNYILTNNLNQNTEGYSEVAGPNANEGKGFNPIGESTLPDISDHDNHFSGVFEGDGNIIEDLIIDRPEENQVGLFSIAGIEDTSILFSNQSEIRNLGLKNIEIVGEERVGGLVAYGDSNLTVRNSFVESSYIDCISGRVGSLIGTNKNGKLLNCHSTETTVMGETIVGGIIGQSDDSEIIDCHSNNEVLARLAYSGGLVGRLNGYMENSYWNGVISSEGSFGGLVGTCEGNITKCFSEGEVNPRNSASSVGGLVGVNSGNLSKSYSLSDITSSRFVGGLAGENIGGVIEECYSSGSLTGHEFIGGLVGYQTNERMGNTYETVVKNCYSTCSINDNEFSGGLIGKISSGSMINSYHAGNFSNRETDSMIGKINPDKYFGNLRDLYIRDCYLFTDSEGRMYTELGWTDEEKSIIVEQNNEILMDSEEENDLSEVVINNNNEDQIQPENLFTQNSTLWKGIEHNGKYYLVLENISEEKQLTQL